jgi:hypothetical protein
MRTLNLEALLLVTAIRMLAASAEDEADTHPASTALRRLYRGDCQLAVTSILGAATPDLNLLDAKLGANKLYGMTEVLRFRGDPEKMLKIIRSMT